MRTLALMTLALATSGCGSDPQGSANTSQIAEAVEANSRAIEVLQRVLSQAGERLPPLRQIRAGKADLVGFRIKSKEAVATWERLRALTDSTGFYPLIFRDEHDLLSSTEDRGVAPPAEILTAASAIRGEQWLQQRAQQASLDPEATPPRGAARAAKPQTEFVVPFNQLTGKAVDDLWLLLIPTKHGHEVPAFIGFGGWNECPNPEVHVAVLRYWKERHGAELVTMSGDVLELRGRPTDSSLALALALEQYHYCTDIVTQGVETVDALAKGLTRSTVWYFWWD